MRHDNRANHAGADTPTRRPAVLLLLVCIQILNVKRFGEVLPEVVRSAGLERALVAHHRLNGIGGKRAGKLLTLTFAAGNDRHGGFVDSKVGVDVEDA